MWVPLICFVVVALLATAGTGVVDAAAGRREVYVVYMGAVPPRTPPSFLQETHLRLVGSVLK